MTARGEALRDDDNPEVLRTRLKAYREETAPLIAHYRQQGVLRTVNGMAPIPEVTQAIDQALSASTAGRAAAPASAAQK
jgi:adenylate kinase